MDILPSGNIFSELQDIHDTGYFSAQSSLEDHWQQVCAFQLYESAIWISHNHAHSFPQNRDVLCGVTIAKVEIGCRIICVEWMFLVLLTTNFFSALRQNSDFQNKFCFKINDNTVTWKYEDAVTIFWNFSDARRELLLSRVTHHGATLLVLSTWIWIIERSFVYNSLAGILSFTSQLLATKLITYRGISINR